MARNMNQTGNIVQQLIQALLANASPEFQRYMNEVQGMDETMKTQRGGQAPNEGSGYRVTAGPNNVYTGRDARRNQREVAGMENTMLTQRGGQAPNEGSGYRVIAGPNNEYRERPSLVPAGVRYRDADYSTVPRMNPQYPAPDWADGLMPEVPQVPPHSRWTGNRVDDPASIRMLMRLLGLG